MKEEKTRKLLERPPGMLTADELTSPSNLAGTSYSSPYPSYGSGSGGRGPSQGNFQRDPPQGTTQPFYVPPHPQPQLHQQPLLPQPRPQPHPQQAQAPAQSSELLNPNSLPLKCPDKRIYLWLSGEILSWKFVARNLGLNESDIETIQTDHHGVEEQRYQMFQVWERRNFQDCNYQKLGKVLFESEKNRKLYPQYVERIKTIEIF